MKPKFDRSVPQTLDENIKEEFVRNKAESYSDQRRTASEREKARMRDMNSAFDRLRIKLNHKKTAGRQMSKIQALRFAIQYIQELQGNLYEAFPNSATYQTKRYKRATNTEELETDGNFDMADDQRSTNSAAEREEQQLFEHLAWHCSVSSRDHY